MILAKEPISTNVKCLTAQLKRTGKINLQTLMLPLLMYKNATLKPSVDVLGARNPVCFIVNKGLIDNCAKFYQARVVLETKS